MVARYLRVSTDKQSTENQEPDLSRMISAREPGSNASTILLTYRETVSATAKVRPEFERMMEDARAGKISRLYIWSLDRFGRRMFENVRDLKLLLHYGVQVVSAREPWLDTTNPLIRELLVAILSWVAQYEHEKLKERTRAGLARAVANGKTLGRPRAGIPEPVISAAIALRSVRPPPGWRVVAMELYARGFGSWSHATLAAACRKRVPDLPRGIQGWRGSPRASGRT